MKKIINKKEYCHCEPQSFVAKQSIFNRMKIAEMFRLRPETTLNKKRLNSPQPLRYLISLQSLSLLNSIRYYKELADKLDILISSLLSALAIKRGSSRWIASNLSVLAMTAALFLSGIVQAACVSADCANLGYTQSVSDCSSADNLIKCPFNTNKVRCVESPVGVQCKTLPMAVGDLYYSSNGYCNVDVHNALVTAGKPTYQAIGVIAYLDSTKQHGLVLNLDETIKTWSNEYYDLPCITNVAWNSSQDGTKQTAAQTAMGGQANTQCIVKTKNSRSATYDAGMYCASYTYGGVGSWFLPASGELYNTMYLGKESVNATLAKLGKTQIDLKNYYWSSTEYTCNGCSPTNAAWPLRPSDGFLDYRYYTGSYKTGTGRVRCVLAF